MTGNCLHYNARKLVKEDVFQNIIYNIGRAERGGGGSGQPPKCFHSP